MGLYREGKGSRRKGMTMCDRDMPGDCGEVGHWKEAYVVAY